jgi:hypothetical protein
MPVDEVPDVISQNTVKTSRESHAASLHAGHRAQYFKENARVKCVGWIRMGMFLARN